MPAGSGDCPVGPQLTSAWHQAVRVAFLHYLLAAGCYSLHQWPTLTPEHSVTACHPAMNDSNSLSAADY